MTNQPHPNSPPQGNGRAAPQGDPVARRRYLAEQYGYTPEQIDVIRNAICISATDAELEFFLATCKRVGLDPFARQIWFVKRRQRIEDSMGNESWVDVGKPETSIDGLRTIAERSGEYEGQGATLWCGSDGKWADAWLRDEQPFAAKATVFRRGFREPLTQVALFREYCPTYRNGKHPAMWQKMGANQLAKCAEAGAMRRAFPRDLSGMVTDVEMEHVAIDGAGYSAPAKSEKAPATTAAAPVQLPAKAESRGEPVYEPPPADEVREALVSSGDEIDQAMAKILAQVTGAKERAELEPVGVILHGAKGKTDEYSQALHDVIRPQFDKRWRALAPAPMKSGSRTVSR